MATPQEEPDLEVTFKNATQKDKEWLSRVTKQYPYDELESEDEIITQDMTLDRAKQILKKRKKRSGPVPNLEHILKNFSDSISLATSRSDSIPNFNGNKDESANAHLLKVEDWKERMKHSSREMVQRFKQTLGGKAREWYNELETTPKNWEELQKLFTIEFTKAGKPKRL